MIAAIHCAHGSKLYHGLLLSGLTSCVRDCSIDRCKVPDRLIIRRGLQHWETAWRGSKEVGHRDEIRSLSGVVLPVRHISFCYSERDAKLVLTTCP